MVELDAHGLNKKIGFNVLSEKEMRAIGFTDAREEDWYYCRYVDSERDITMDVTIPKDSNKDEFRIDVLDENFLQPYDFQRVLIENSEHEYACEVRDNVEKEMKYLKDAGVITGHEFGEYI